MLSKLLNQQPIYTTSHATACPHCGAVVKEYWHSLSPGLVGALIKMLRAVKAKGINEVHLQTEVELTKNEYNNFQKLRFHGLVAKAKMNGEHKTGYWVITDRAGKFLRGEIGVPFKVKTFRNKVIGYSEDRVNIFYYKYQPGWFEKEFAFEIRDGLIAPLEHRQGILLETANAYG